MSWCSHLGRRLVPTAGLLIAVTVAGDAERKRSVSGQKRGPAYAGPLSRGLLTLVLF